MESLSAKKRHDHRTEKVTGAGMFANLGRALLRVRELRGKTLTRVARDARVGKSQLSKYEKGKDLPLLETLGRILLALEIDVVEFFDAVDTLDRKKSVEPTEVGEKFQDLTRGILDLHRRVVTVETNSAAGRKRRGAQGSEPRAVGAD